MKSLLSFLLFLCAFFMLSAQIPEPVARTQKLIEQRTLVWKAASVKPLSETVKAAFAQNGWRIVLQRPMESRRKNGVLEGVKPGEQRNTAELVFVKSGYKINEIRSKITWLNEPGELITTVVYLGKQWDYDLFLRGDIATIGAVVNLVKPVGGDDLFQIYAAALNMEDYRNTSKKAAIQQLLDGGNRVIPLINKSMGLAISQDLDTTPHFACLKQINTKESVAVIISAIHSKIPAVVKKAETALVMPPASKGAEKIYLSFLQRRKYIAESLTALDELNYRKQALPVINYLMREPESFTQYAMLVFAEYRFRTDSKNIPELDMIEQIRMLLARVGDLPGTPKFISVADKSDNLEAEKMTEERKRVAPLEREFAKSKEKTAICAALILCQYNPTDRTYNKDYIKRVNEEGLRLLKLLPRGQVRSVLRLLRDHVTDAKDEEFLRKIMIQVGGY